MTTKEYLSQLKILDLKITHTIEEIDHLKALALGRGIAYDKDRVQTSPENRQEELIAKWVDLEREIDREIAQRSRIINEIQSLENRNYSRVLYERFALGKTFMEIAKSIPCGEATVYRWYNKGLQIFFDKFLRGTEDA